MHGKAMFRTMCVSVCMTFETIYIKTFIFVPVVHIGHIFIKFEYQGSLGKGHPVKIFNFAT